MSIQYGSAIFSEPLAFTIWSPSYRAGFYAILVPDPSVAPRPFNVLYSGQSGTYSERGFPRGHHAYSCWISRAGGESYLFVATNEMPKSTEAKRRALERNLLTAYKPPCNL